MVKSKYLQKLVDYIEKELETIASFESYDDGDEIPPTIGDVQLIVNYLRLAAGVVVCII